MANTFNVSHVDGTENLINTIFADFLLAEEKLAGRGKSPQSHKILFNTTAIYNAYKRTGLTSDPFTVWVANLDNYTEAEDEADDAEEDVDISFL